MSSIVESASGITALPARHQLEQRAISFGVVTPRPYFTELSMATLELRRKLFECTFVCFRPSDSILSQTRRMMIRSRSRLVAVLSLIVDHEPCGVVHGEIVPSCRNCSVPEPGTLSILSTVSGSSSENLPFATRSNTVTRIGTLIRLAVGKVSSPRRRVAARFEIHDRVADDALVIVGDRIEHAPSEVVSARTIDEVGFGAAAGWANAEQATQAAANSGRDRSVIDRQYEHGAVLSIQTSVPRSHHTVAADTSARLRGPTNAIRFIELQPRRHAEKQSSPA